MRKFKTTLFLFVLALGFTNGNYAQTWLPVGSGFPDVWDPNILMATAEYNNEIFVAVSHSTSYNDYTTKVYRWDGLSWMSTTDLPDSTFSIEDIEIVNGDIYLSGLCKPTSTLYKYSNGGWTGYQSPVGSIWGRQYMREEGGILYIAQSSSNGEFVLSFSNSAFTLLPSLPSGFILMISSILTIAYMLVDGVLLHQL